MKKIKNNYEKCLSEAKSSFDFVVRAIEHHLFTGAIPLLLSAGTFAFLRFGPGPVRSSLSNLVQQKFLGADHVDTELSVDA